MYASPTVSIFSYWCRSAIASNSEEAVEQVYDLLGMIAQKLR
jgi:hypothetical protein